MSYNSKTTNKYNKVLQHQNKITKYPKEVNLYGIK